MAGIYSDCSTREIIIIIITLIINFQSRNRKMAVQVIISLIIPNQSQRSRSSATANDVSSAVRRIVKCNTRKLRPSWDYQHSGESNTFSYMYREISCEVEISETMNVLIKWLQRNKYIGT